MSAEGLKASVEKMEAEGIPEAAIATFPHYYEQLESGETGLLPEDTIEPVEDVTELADLPEEDGPLDRAVVLKLNGGLGTSMGMTQAKSLIEAKDGMAFLDVVARQVEALRERAGAPVPRVLAWIAREGIPFVMEVTDRTEADRKGGHIAKRPEGGYLLRETAQTPEEDLDALQDISRHRYVNTNHLWVDLEALKRLLEEREGVLGLPLIVNKKTVDPGDKSSPEVFQLETAMGAAVGVFDGARPLRVPRTRFSPVKSTEDLLALRSDAYVLTDDAR